MVDYYQKLCDIPLYRVTQAIIDLSDINGSTVQDIYYQSEIICSIYPLSINNIQDALTYGIDIDVLSRVNDNYRVNWDMIRYGENFDIFRDLIENIFTSFRSFYSGITIFVSPNGSDLNDGQINSPLATLEAAQEKVRTIKAERGIPPRGITVYLRQGEYHLTQPWVFTDIDSGSTEFPIVYSAYHDEMPRIIGGVLIPADEFTEVIDSTFLDNLITPAARRRILKVNLNSLGLTDFGVISIIESIDFGRDGQYPPAPMQVFIDREPATLVRYPNKDEQRPNLGNIQNAKMLIQTDIDGNPVQYDQLDTNTEVFSTGDDLYGLSPLLGYRRALLWNMNPADMWVGGGLLRAYSYFTRRITNISNGGRLTLDTPIELWSTYNQTEAYPLVYFNVPEEMDRPGEYYIDRSSGILYLYTPDSWSSDTEVIVSTLSEPILCLEDVKHTRFKGITFEITRTTGVYWERGEDNVLENCTIRNCGIVGAQLGYGYDAQAQALLPRLPGEYRWALSRAFYQHPTHPTGKSALNREAGRDNGLVKCRVYSTGLGGVLLGGGDRKTLTPARNFVRDCNIYSTDCSANRYAENVVIDGVGNYVQRCYLHDNQGGMLYFYGNNHIMEYNEIAYGVTTGTDCGAIESRQNASQLGNIIRYNYIHNIGRITETPLSAQTYAIYLDNYVHGTTIFGNVIANNQGRTISGFSPLTISINGGHLHTVANNIFVDNEGGIILDGNELAPTRGWFVAYPVTLIVDVDVRTHPFSTEYPEFAELYSGVIANDPDVKLFNRVYNNVQVGCSAAFGESRYPGQEYRYDNLEIDTDPGFVDDSKDDYTLLPTSRVYTDIPDFEPVPFEEMLQAQKW